jgi:5-dehydro-2-deoxygluconokinase
MLSSDCVYMLAADHRWQWEEWCDARSIPRTRIPEVKRLAADGFRLARDRSPRVREFGALLLDAQYSSDVIGEARRDGLIVGTPAEKAGAFPLAWSTEPFERGAHRHVRQGLVRFRPDDADGDPRRPVAQAGHAPGVVPSRRYPVGRRSPRPAPAGTRGAVRYRGPSSDARRLHRRVVPPRSDPAVLEDRRHTRADGARTIDRAIAARPQCRQIILGKAADIATIERWFAAAHDSPTAVGFAIGRSVFWEPSTAFLAGSSTAADAAANICANYLQLVNAWRR